MISDRLLLARFWTKVDRTGDCWLWTGAQNGVGYGQMNVGGRPELAHRLSWEIKHGEPPAADLDIDHLCRNRACVNPAHLEVVTRSVNLARGFAARGPKTECLRGHAYTPENTYVNSRGHQECRTCRLDRQRARRAAVRAA